MELKIATDTILKICLLSEIVFSFLLKEIYH